MDKNGTQLFSPGNGRGTNARPKNLVFISSMLLAFLASPLTGDSANEEPREIIDWLQNSLIEAMKGGHEIGFTGRYKLLEPVVLGTHRLKSIARVALGRYWKDLSEEERTQFLEKLSILSVSGYASRFHKYQGEHFEVVAEETGKRGQIMIKCDLYLKDGDTIRLVYILSRAAGEWKIINVVARGISDLALKRAEYTSIMSKDGFPTLMEKITEQIKKIEQKHIDAGT